METLTLRDLRRPTTHRAMSNIRSIKMFYPSCKSEPETGFEGCEDEPGASGTLWWKGCIAKGHDPYYTISRKRELRDVTEAILDANGNPTGRYKVTGQEETIVLVETPNTKQVHVTPHVSGLTYGFDPLTWARARGLIYVTDHPTKPLKDFCEYHNCWSQQIVTRTGAGNYCTEEAAKRIVLGQRGKAIEALNHDKMQEQLDSVRL